MGFLKVLLVGILFLSYSLTAQSLSGSEKMDYEIRSMIADLKMTESVHTKFIEIYKKYGAVMKKAKQSGISRWSLYMIFLRASGERDLQINEILTRQQYDFYLVRQKKIDKMASSL